MNKIKTSKTKALITSHNYVDCHLSLIKSMNKYRGINK